MSFFDRQRDSVLKAFNASRVNRGKTVAGTNAGSFAPTDYSAVEAELAKTFSSFVSSKESAIVGRPRQPVSGKDAVYEQASKAVPELQTWLDKGKGVAIQLGYEHVKKRPEDVTAAEFAKPGGMLFVAPLKEVGRAAQKVNAEYKGDWSQIRDLARATIAVDKVSDIQTVLAALRESGMELAMAPKNRFVTPTDVGYRDLLLNYTDPATGHIGELQIQLKGMMSAKNEGHLHYEVSRSIEARHTRDGIKADESTWPPSDLAIYRKAKAAQTKIYGAAWKKILKEAA